jgi:hypothetical protein
VTAAATHRSEPALAAALLSAGAAAIHASAAGPHLSEHVLIGALFVITALAQAAWAALLLTSPSALLLAGGAVGNLGVVGAWAMSRTVGLPIGPEPWTPEPAAPIDLAATSFEVGAAAACVLLLAAGGPYTAVSGRAAARFATVGAIAIAALTSAAYAGSPSGGHHHGAAGEAEPAAHDHAAVPAARAAPRARPAVAPKRRAAASAKRAKKRQRAHAHVHANAVPHSH